MSMNEKSDPNLKENFLEVFLELCRKQGLRMNKNFMLPHKKSIALKDSMYFRASNRVQVVS